jgi:hypothetical protein
MTKKESVINIVISVNTNDKKESVINIVISANKLYQLEAKKEKND